MYADVWANVIANVITAIIFAALGLITFIAIFLIERQRLLRFFGVSSKLPGLRLYLSRLEILPGGTKGIEEITKGYSGPAINKIEFEGALLLRNRLRSTVLGLFPRRFRDWLGQKHVSLIMLDPAIAISPTQTGQIQFDNLVILGSSIYNYAAQKYLNHPSSCFYFDKEANGERVIKIKTPSLAGTLLPGRSQQQEIAILQRINDIAQGNTVFLCSGLGASGTYGSARYLAKNWETIYRKYGCEEFGLCLAFPNQEANSELVVDPIIIYEVPRPGTNIRNSVVLPGTAVRQEPRNMIL